MNVDEEGWNAQFRTFSEQESTEAQVEMGLRRVTEASGQFQGMSLQHSHISSFSLVQNVSGRPPVQYNEDVFAA